MTRADLTLCEKMPDAREEKNISVREERIESRHSTFWIFMSPTRLANSERLFMHQEGQTAAL